MTDQDQRKSKPHPVREARRKRRTKIFVVIFVLAAVLLAIYASIVFKKMLEDRELQEKIEEVRQGDR